MKTFKRLVVVIALAMVVAGNTVAGEVNTPPCTTDPGEVNTPPCSSSQLLTDNTVAQTAVTSSEVEMLTIATTISAIENLLTIY